MLREANAATTRATIAAHLPTATFCNKKEGRSPIHRRPEKKKHHRKECAGLNSSLANGCGLPRVTPRETFLRAIASLRTSMPQPAWLACCLRSLSPHRRPRGLGHQAVYLSRGWSSRTPATMLQMEDVLLCSSRG